MARTSARKGTAPRAKRATTRRERPASARRRDASAPPDRGADTRARIVAAALGEFADRGFEGASTREISAAAGVNQGLITYHFASKESLWRAAVDAMFEELDRELASLAAELAALDVRGRLRALLVRWVRFVAAHPEQMRLMVQEGKSDGPRLAWLVDRHLRRFYELFDALAREAQEAGFVPADVPRAHLYYVVIGAASLIFTAAPECQRLTGRDPLRPAIVEAHADALLRLLMR